MPAHPATLPTGTPRTRYRGRFAPSPTGALHLGSLLTAVASFLQAKSQGGEWMLRIDDIDRERCSDTATAAILRCLERYRLHWDGPVIYQRMRTERYREAFDTLLRTGLVYGCRCSRKELTGHRIYPGICRRRLIPADTASVAARIRTDGRSVCFIDYLHGPQSHDLMPRTGDFIVRRRDGTYAYHLATVVDDADTDVVEVVRGSDLLDSTPGQIYLQQVLQLPTPRYGHTPILLAVDGRKLSKQNAAPPIDELDPSATLRRILGLLQHAPPRCLEGATVADILEWAIGTWNMSRLRGVPNLRPLAASETRSPAVASARPPSSDRSE